MRMCSNFIWHGKYISRWLINSYTKVYDEMTIFANGKNVCRQCLDTVHSLYDGYDLCFIVAMMYVGFQYVCI